MSRLRDLPAFMGDWVHICNGVADLIPEGQKCSACGTSEPDDITERQMQDEEQPDDEANCPECEGDGGDKWNDYCLPCPTCGGDGRLW